MLRIANKKGPQGSAKVLVKVGGDGIAFLNLGLGDSFYSFHLIPV